jgi:hypothetical protein
MRLANPPPLLLPPLPFRVRKGKFRTMFAQEHRCKSIEDSFNSMHRDKVGKSGGKLASEFFPK